MQADLRDAVALVFQVASSAQNMPVSPTSNVFVYSIMPVTAWPGSTTAVVGSSPTGGYVQVWIGDVRTGDDRGCADGDIKTLNRFEIQLTTTPPTLQRLPLKAVLSICASPLFSNPSGLVLLSNPVVFWEVNDCTNGKSCLPYIFWTYNAW